MLKLKKMPNNSFQRAAAEAGVIFYFLRAISGKKSVVERVEAECCELRFDVKKLTQMWKI